MHAKLLLWSAILAVWLGGNFLAFRLLDWGTPPPHVSKRPSPRVLRQYKAESWPPTSSGKTSEAHALPYRLLEPLHKDRPQPLLLFLHGAGQRGHDNSSQLLGLPSLLTEHPWRTRYPGFVLAPQCPEGSDWRRQLPRLLALLEAWRNDPRVDRRRIYVTGFSMGGFGTWHLAAAKPEWFAAVVPLCGGGDPSSASRLVTVPIWAVHGSEDQIVSPEQSRSMIQAIRAAGGAPHYTELPGIGHDCWTPTYSEPEGVLSWMFQQINLRDEPPH